MKTRRSIRVGAAIAAIAAIGMGLFAVGGTSAAPLPVQLPTDDLVDLVVDIQSLPSEHIAPAGEAGVVYRIEVSEDAELQHIDLDQQLATVTGTLPADFTITDAGGCTVTLPTYSCPVTSLPQTFDIALVTADALATYTRTATATVTSGGLLEPIEYQTNNTDQVTITVYPTLNNNNETWAHVCPGCSVSFSDPDVGTATITDPGSENGFFVRIRQDDTFTVGIHGGHDWNPALGVYFNEDEPDYQVEDPTEPVVVAYVPVQAPCAGVGADKCAQLGMYDPDIKFGMTAPELLQSCDGAGTGTNSGDGEAFVDGEYRVCRDSSFKVGALVGHNVLMITNDPLLPPISL